MKAYSEFHVIVRFSVSMKLMYEVQCNRYFNTADSDFIPLDSPVDDMANCRQVT